MNARIRLIQSIAAPIDEARNLVDLHHAEVLTTARPQIKAETLRQAAVDLITACPDHGDADEAWMDCPCEIADELSRHADLAGERTSENQIADPRAEVLAEAADAIDAKVAATPRERGTSGAHRRGMAAAANLVRRLIEEKDTAPAATSTPAPEAYPGELAMLRGLLGVLRVTAQHADMAEVQRLLAEHAADEQAAYAEAGDDRG